MKQRTIFVVLTLALLLGSGVSLAIDNKTETSQPVAAKVDASPKSAKHAVDAKQKATAQIKLVDINSANKNELMKLPGIGAAEADKIIAGRPFGSKAWLVTKNIVPGITYQALKNKIICKLSKAEIEKIEAMSAQSTKK